MCLEVPVDAVGIALATQDMFGDSSFQVDERNIVLLAHSVIALTVPGLP